MRSRYRLGIDAGGTFTDFVLADQTGNVRLFKTLSTPADPTVAIASGLQLIAEEVGESPSAIVGDCDLCINGTTVGLNALIQHKGGKTGLICTAGHEDSLEIRLGHKEDGYRYDPEYPAAIMLVPRYLRKGVRERVIRMMSSHAPEHYVKAAEFYTSMPYLTPRLQDVACPILGICGGHQQIALAYGAPVDLMARLEPGTGYDGAKRERGYFPIETEQEGLFTGLPSQLTVWHSHFDEVKELPGGQ